MGKVGKYKISVVTAVYNVEEYLQEMIESITVQTIGFANVQLILIDDGSQDSSGQICDQYALQYPENIIVIHKENGGVSSARNEGLRYVKGEYINFTDADDMLENNALELMFAYLKENEEEIDLVAIPLKLLGGGYKEHPLNYKFDSMKIIDLEKDYSYVQLSINSTMIKRECFEKRRFDIELSYAEDAQILVDILLDKLRYGVISQTSYLCRKYKDDGAALDLSRGKVNYYIPCMEKFILHSLQNALSKKGIVPEFVQYTCMYDLQWRLDKDPLVDYGVLNKIEINKYKDLILQALHYIDNKIIVGQKNIGNNYKAAILLLKQENLQRKEIVLSPDDIKIRVRGSFTSVGVSSYTMAYEFFQIFSDKIVIEGYVRCFPELEGMEIILKQLNNNKDILMEYKAIITDRKERCTFCMDTLVTEAKGFLFSINRNSIFDDIELQLCLRYKDVDVICKNIWFGKFFPLSMQLSTSYFYQDGVLLTSYEGMLRLEYITSKCKIKEFEHRFQEEIISNTEHGLQDDLKLRKAYNILKRLKRKELWLISDRKTKADDNGEAFFTYMNTKGKSRKIDTYFVLDRESKDYERLCKIGKVVSFGSRKHKLLALLCDKIISSQGEDFVFNVFGDKLYLYKDIMHQQKFVFLQHGITKDDLSRWLMKPNKNISLFITTTNMEYQSILDCEYYYNKLQVKCTGFPRYDYLYDNSEYEKLIIFMPTWRAYLVDKYNVDSDSRDLKRGFGNSLYCQMYQKLFSDDRLYNAIKKNGYKLGIMWHPMMPRECMEHICQNKEITIYDRNMQYKQLFAIAKLVITDYSSAVFDFAYLRKPVLYYQNDIEEFYSGKHTYNKGYFDYEKDGFGEVEYTTESLINRIIEYVENGCQLKDRYRERIEKTFPFHDKENCKRVYEEIIKI